MPTSNAPSHGEGGPLMLVPFTGLPPEVMIKALTAPAAPLSDALG